VNSPAKAGEFPISKGSASALPFFSTGNERQPPEGTAFKFILENSVNHEEHEEKQ
jgi:hypothetical protein